MKYAVTSFQNLKLNTKLNMISLSIFIGGIITINLILSNLIFPQTETRLKEKALLAIETMNAVRNYTSTQVKPELSERLKTDISFLPETVPAYSAREVFAHLKSNPEYENFDYKEATLNPTNLKDQADAFETSLIEKFRENEGREQISGFRKIDRQSYYYLARPLEVKDASCLECHGHPEQAPQSLLTIYGENGMGWQLNEIVASQIATVPANQTRESVHNLKWSLSMIFSLCLIIILIIFYWFVKFSLIEPLQELATTAKRISKGKTNASFLHRQNDEIGILARSFNQMIANYHSALQKAKKN